MYPDGSGVELDRSSWTLDHSSWTQAVSRQNSSWVIYPTGRTSWGYDWHGPSTLDIWASHAALRSLISSRDEWKAWSIDESRVILLGHSNGGQGVWYQASRFPDRVLAAIPAAAYIKSQLYPSTALSHSAHFMDTTLRGILESALQPDDNDLYLSNLVSVQILAIHGGDDMDVPAWHSRQLYAGLKTWYPKANISYHEEQGKPHRWDTILSADYVQNFLDKVVASNTTSLPPSFTLTTSITAESGSLHGFSIRQLELPGALGRLRVESGVGPEVLVNTENVWEFSVDKSSLKPETVLVVDGVEIKIEEGDPTIWLSKARREGDPNPDGRMGTTAAPSSISSALPCQPVHETHCRPSGPLNRILSGDGAITIVAPQNSPHHLSASTRIAHNLLAYLKIDSQILFDNEATKLLDEKRLGCSNIIILGGLSNSFGQRIMPKNPKSVVFKETGWTLQDRQFVSPGSGNVLVLDVCVVFTR
jgi:predicted esterase